MPPIAEEMAGGNAPPPPPPEQQQQQQQEQQLQLQQQAPVQKKSQNRPSRSTSSAPSHKTSSAKQKRSKRPKDPSAPQQPRQFLSPEDNMTGGEEEDSGTSSVSTSVVDDSNDDDVDGGTTMLRLSSQQSKNVESATMEQYSVDPNMATEFFKKEPCIYSHRMYLRAATIFAHLRKIREAKMEKRRMGGKQVGLPAVEQDIEPLDFKTMREQKLTYELAFASLKFEAIFEDMLEDCAFFSLYPEMRDCECLVLVVLWDYQSRKFQPRIQFDVDELAREVTQIELGIMDQKTKLAASLARRRIKEAAPTIDYLLPDKMRKKSSIKKPLPVYAWVNTVKISPFELLQKLKEDKFTQLWDAPQVARDWKDRSFYLDVHCSDVMVFSPDCNAALQDHHLIEEGLMVKQDKSSCLASHSVVHLLGDEYDALVVNPGAGLTAAHVAVLLSKRKGGVVVVSQDTDEDYYKMMRKFELIGVNKMVKVVREDFMNIDSDDSRLKGVRAALVIAKCSKSAVANIVNYIVTEGDNLNLLQDLSDQCEDMDDQMLQLQENHIAVLRQALKLTRVQGVTYLTRSVYDQENDAVVQRVLEYVNMVQMAHKLRPWRVIPPVLPFSAQEIDEQLGIEGKNAVFKPSDFMNGCFIVCLAREPEDPAEAASRARAQKALKNKLKTSGSSSGSSDGANKTRKKSQKKTTKPPKVSNSEGPSSSGSASAGGSPSRQSTRERVPEHVRVIKHPAPFR
ncbi:hypothetical protein ACOMHN_033344 [Nucella lapillus]